MFKICRHQLRMALVSPRFYIALFMGCAIHIVGIMPLLAYAKGIGKPLSLLEGFVYFSCERYTVAAVFLSIVFLVSDVPFSSENETYTLLRVSRKKWLAGMAFLSGNAFVGNFWSEPVYYLTQGLDLGEYSAYFPYPHVLLLRPLQAVLAAVMLHVAYGFTMSLFLFFCNLKLPRTLGYAVTMLLHAVFYMMLSVFQSSYYARYSLLGNSLLMYHSIYGEYRELLPSLGQSFLVFGIAAAVLLIVIFQEIPKYDFRITEGTKQ